MQHWFLIKICCSHLFAALFGQEVLGNVHVTPTGAAQIWKPVPLSSWCSLYADANTRGSLELCNHSVSRALTTFTHSHLQLYLV